MKSIYTYIYIIGSSLHQSHVFWFIGLSGDIYIYIIGSPLNQRQVFWFLGACQCAADQCQR